MDGLDEGLPDWSRTYCGYRERFVEPYTLHLDGSQIKLSLAQAPCVSAEHAREAKASADGSCTASTVWDAGIVLATHVFERFRRSGDRGVGSRCLDLGSGTGIVGLAAAASGGFTHVVLTDLPSVVPLLERNVERNRAAIDDGVSVESMPLCWDDVAKLQHCACSFGPFDLLVGGDLLYRLPVVEPLLVAVSHLASKQTTVLLAASLQHSPETISRFAQVATAAGFRVEFLGLEAQSAQCRSPEVRLLCLTRVNFKKLKGHRKLKKLKKLRKFKKFKELRRPQDGHVPAAVACPPRE